MQITETILLTNFNGYNFQKTANRRFKNKKVSKGFNAHWRLVVYLYTEAKQ